MKNIFTIILTILVFTLFFALLPSLPAAAGQYAEAASRAMAQPEIDRPIHRQRAGLGSNPDCFRLRADDACSPHPPDRADRSQLCNFRGCPAIT